MKKKLEVWQQPIVFEDPRYRTITKAQHTKITKDLGYPLTWPARSERDRRSKNNDGTMD